MSLANGDSGAVAEDVDLAPFLNRGFDGAAAIGCAAHIAVERNRVAVLILNLGNGLASLRVINFEHGDRRTHFGQQESNAATDT